MKNKRLILATMTSILLVGCSMTPKDEADYYTNIENACGVDVRIVDRKKVFGLGMTNECLNLQYGKAFASNVSVFGGVVREQRIYTNVTRITYSLPKYVYLRDGIVTSFQY